jgi:hypothetical protein
MFDRQNSTSALSETDGAPPPAMPTTPTTAMIVSSGKRVRYPCPPGHLEAFVIPMWLTWGPIVCVSSLVVDEIKRIIKSSEIMK